MLSENYMYMLLVNGTPHPQACMGLAVVQVVCSLQQVFYRLSHFFTVIYTCVQQMEFQAYSASMRLLRLARQVCAVQNTSNCSACSYCCTCSTLKVYAHLHAQGMCSLELYSLKYMITISYYY